MLLKDFLPKPENRKLVRVYRIIHFKFSAGVTPPMKAYPPRPEQVLSFFPLDLEKAQYGNKQLDPHRYLFTGQHDCVTNRFVPNEFLCLQIVFQPSGFHLLTGVPGIEVRNQYLDAQHFFSVRLEEVNDQLFHSKSYQEMIDVADGFVSRLRPVKTYARFDNVVHYMLATEGKTSLDWLANQTSLSPKQFERNFKLRTGVSPKTFLRIARFDKAFRMKNQFPELDWLSVAINSGYYDYQHMAKDYLDFTTLTPASFHVIENKAPERVFGLHEGFYDSRIV
jgi:AraC-like DNA-binding protein